MSDGTTAIEYYGLACKHGSYPGCAKLGHLILHPYDSAQDDAYTHVGAMQALARACQGKIADACAELDGECKGGDDDACDRWRAIH